MFQYCNARLLLALLLLSTMGGCATSTITDRESPPADAHDLSPAESAKVCIATARQLDAAGYEREAIGQYERARAFFPSADVSPRLAVLYDRQGSDAKAVEEYKRALSDHPNDASIQNDFACFYLVRGDLTNAESLLSNIVRRDSAPRRAWVNLGIVFGSEGRYDEGLAAFNHVLTLPESRCNLGILMAQRGDNAQAKDMLAQALQADASLSQARAFLAVLTKHDSSH